MKPTMIIIGFAGILFLIGLGAWYMSSNRAPPDDGRNSAEEKKQTISKDSAIEIARQAWGPSPRVENAPVEVSLDTERNEYVVIFRTVLPPNSTGSDYHAKITIDASTGKVKRKLGG